jgi:hypothetical protein
MSKKKKLSTRKKNQKKKNMNKIYSVSLTLARILVSFLIDTFMK